MGNRVQTHRRPIVAHIFRSGAFILRAALFFKSGSSAFEQAPVLRADGPQGPGQKRHSGKRAVFAHAAVARKWVSRANELQ
eukprot:6279484-Alexandrium_andersonii.AAC.1